MFGKGIDAAKFVADFSTMLERLADLEAGQTRLAQVTEQKMGEFSARLAVVEAELRAIRARIRADVVEAVADRVQASQRDLNEQLRDLAVLVDRQARPRLDRPDQD